MKDPALEKGYRFLYDHAKPIVKHEAAAALGLGTDALRAERIACPEVQYWIGRLHLFTGSPQVHNADDHCLENAMHKLASFGVAEGDDPRIGETNRFILNLLQARRGDLRFYDTINPTIAASWLAYAGHSEPLVMELLRERIELVYDFVRKKDYGLYVLPDGYPAIPAARRGAPLVDPALYEGNRWRLPTVHDLFAFAHLPPSLSGDPELAPKIDAIAAYILDDRYQRLHPGYGLMLVPPNRYYAMGWSVQLSGWFEDRPLAGASLLWCMDLMAPFAPARQSAWFQRMLRHLEAQGSDGIYEFPKEYLKEAHRSYYVGGGAHGPGRGQKTKKLAKN